MLNYLFKAEFKDGTSIQQTQEDVSLLDSRRNQFYDVLNSGRELKTLSITEQKVWNPTTLSVNLETGNFTLNGKELLMEPIVDKKTGKYLVIKGRQPIKYQTVKQHANATYNVKTLKLLDIEGTGEERIFYIGWKATVNGKSYQQVFGIK